MDRTDISVCAAEGTLDIILTTLKDRKLHLGLAEHEMHQTGQYYKCGGVSRSYQ